MHDWSAVTALVKQPIFSSVSLSLQHLDSLVGHNLADPTHFEEGIPMEMIGQIQHRGSWN